MSRDAVLLWDSEVRPVQQPPDVTEHCAVYTVLSSLTPRSPPGTRTMAVDSTPHLQALGSGGAAAHPRPPREHGRAGLHGGTACLGAAPSCGTAFVPSALAPSLCSGSVWHRAAVGIYTPRGQGR